MDRLSPLFVERPLDLTHLILLGIHKGIPIHVAPSGNLQTESVNERVGDEDSVQELVNTLPSTEFKPPKKSKRRGRQRKGRGWTSESFKRRRLVGRSKWNAGNFFY